MSNQPPDRPPEGWGPPPEGPPVPPQGWGPAPGEPTQLQPQQQYPGQQASPGWGLPPNPPKTAAPSQSRPWYKQLIPWLLIALAFIVGGVIGTAGGTIDQQPTAASAPPPPPPSAEIRYVFTTDCGQLDSNDQQLKCERAKFELEQAKKADSAPTTTKPPATTKPPEPTFSDGVYEVGADIKSGKYKTSGSPDGCYWARLKTPGDILDNNISNGPQVVIVRSSDGYVEFSGGCEWRRA